MQKQSNKELKKQRVIQYFIDAATEMALTTGIQSITIRNVSARAGYNSATLYNYFEDLNQLIAFAAINCVSEYWKKLSDIDSMQIDPLKKYIKVWLTHCQLAFTNPDLYNYVLITDNSHNLYAYMEQYYSIFPEKYLLLSDKIKKIVVEGNPHTRDLMYLQECIDAHYFSRESAPKIIEYVYLITDGFMFQVMNRHNKPTASYQDDFIRYMSLFLEQYNISGKPLELI